MNAAWCMIHENRIIIDLIYLRVLKCIEFSLQSCISQMNGSSFIVLFDIILEYFAILLFVCVCRKQYVDQYANFVLEKPHFHRMTNSFREIIIKNDIDMNSMNYLLNDWFPFILILISEIQNCESKSIFHPFFISNFAARIHEWNRFAAATWNHS